MEKLNREIEKELYLLKLDQEKTIKDLNVSKTSIVNDIKSFKKEDIVNTKYIEKKYTIWERIKKVLGMN